MSTAVQVNVSVYSTTHVASNLVRSLKQLVLACGLNASKLLGEWQALENGVATWLASCHLQTLTLEIYGASSGVLVTRFDFTIDYTYHPNGNGDLWIDNDTVNYAVTKDWGLFASIAYVDVKSKVVVSGPNVLTTKIDYRPLVYSIGGYWLF